MSFDFNHLRNITLFVPLFTLCLGIFVVLFSTLKFKKIKPEYKKVLLLLIIVGSFFIFQSVSSLKYGYKLLYDSPNQTTTITGDVESITDLNMGLKYYYEGKTVSPKIIKISGEDYYFMTNGDIEVLDTITVTFLNDSKFVLTVELEIEE